MPSNFTPAPKQEMRQAAKKNAKAGDVAEVGNGLMYVREDPRPISCNKNLVANFGWYIDTILFDDEPDDDPEHTFIIMPITEVPE